MAAKVLEALDEDGLEEGLKSLDKGWNDRSHQVIGRLHNLCVVLLQHVRIVGIVRPSACACAVVREQVTQGGT